MSDWNRQGSMYGTPNLVQDSSSKKSDSTCRQQSSPSGVLTLHVKQGKNLRILDAASKGFSKRLPVSIYIRIIAGGRAKTTCISEVRCGNGIYCKFDDLKYFLLSINNKLDDETNAVKMHLMGYQGNGGHKKLGEKEVHLFNIVKHLYIAEKMDFTRNAYVIGDIDVEMAFSYGCFGYGYSSQLMCKTKMPSEKIGQSLFPRMEPPSDRLSEKDVMTPIPVPRPTFINWTVKADLVPGSSELWTDSVTALFTNGHKSTGQHSLLISKMKKRMIDLQSNFYSLDTRYKRLEFLESLITADANSEFDEEPQQFFLHRDTSSDLETNVVNPKDQDVEHCLERKEKAKRVKMSDQFDNIYSNKMGSSRGQLLIET